MDIQCLENPPHVFVIENFYTEDELNKIWEELDDLYDKNFLDNSSNVGPARTRDGISLKKANGVFLYESKFPNSNIIKLNKKIKECSLLFAQQDKTYAKLGECVYNTLISYYSNGHYYKPHDDQSIFTACSYFFKEPKKFSGGNFILNDFNKEFEIKNNMVIIFPGKYTHQARKVELKKEFPDYGRYCISQFFNIPVPEESEEKKND